jgi:hypothetical protein
MVQGGSRRFGVRLAIAAGCVFLLACGRDGVNPLESSTEQGSLSFQYSGATSGSFKVRGSPARAGASHAGEFAVATVDAPAGTLWVLAHRDRGSGLFDRVLLTGPARAGRFEAGLECRGAGCARFFADFGATDAGAAFRCVLRSGTVEIRRFDGNGARGTVSGTGSCTGPRGDDLGSFAVRNGSFAVPLVPAE